MIVDIPSRFGEKQSEELNVLPFYISIGVIGGTLTIIASFTVLFRDNIVSLSLTHQIEKVETKMRNMRKIR